MDMIRLARLAAVRGQIRDADLLLYRRAPGLISWIISAFGRGVHSHAAKAAWWEEELMVLEVVEFAGGRAQTLASQVERMPGRIDVYEANAGGRWPEYDAAGSVAYSRRLAGCRYGYLGVARVALLHLPFVRCFTTPDLRDDGNGHTPFCSHACALADRIGGGVDPVFHLADRMTEPADLARSPFYRYRFTLVP